jgi:hypothetical protein
MSEHEHTEPDADERGDEPDEDDAAEVSEPEAADDDPRDA